jgi:stress-induced morphogen
VGRQLAPFRTSRQHRPDSKILDKEIACIHSTSIRTIGQHRPVAKILDKEIACIHSTSVRTTG